jgi:hypothetical protein
MSTKTRIRFFFFLSSEFIALLFSCKNVTSVSYQSIEVKTPVTIISAKFKPVTSTVDLPAVSSFMNKNIVRATTTGIIENILIRQGAYVVSDQLLFTIRTRESMALGNITGKDSSLSFKGLINIASPEAGVINSISYQKGDFVQEGDAIAVISEQNSLVFILDVPFEYQSVVEKNRNCIIVLPDKRKINGTITGKLSEMEMQSQTVSYIVKPSLTVQLPANLIARISLITSSNNNALVIPKEAVSGNETQTEFWVMKLLNDTTAIRVNIRKGYENNDEIEILEPSFRESDRIVLKGNYGLPDTAGIAIIKEE